MSLSSLWPCLALLLLCPFFTMQETPFQRVLDLLSPGQTALNYSSVADLIKRLEDRVHCGNVSCEKCLTPSILFNSLKKSPESQLDAQGFAALSGGLLSYVSDPSSTCGAVKVGNWLKSLLPENYQALETALYIITTILSHYEPNDQIGECVNAEQILNLTSDPHHVTPMIEEALLAVVLEGSCLTILPPPDYFIKYIYKSYGKNGLNVTGLTNLMKNLLLLNEDYNGDDHEHDHDHEEDHNNQTDENPRRWRSLGGGDIHIHHWDQTCFSPEDILTIHGVNVEEDISPQKFQELSSSLIQQQLIGLCPDDHEHGATDGQLSTAEKYIYASIATLIVCLCALFGIVVLLCSACTAAYQYIIQFFVSLAVGSLTGDAILHLIPQGDEDNEGHGHDHGVSLRNFHEEQKKKKQQKQSVSQTELVSPDIEFQKSPRPVRSRELRMIPYMITIGDAIHNFADGLAMGAAFSTSWKTGLATSLAVLCHELPHELGDFAALLHAGISVRLALLLNFGSALTSFIGLYIALSIAAEEAIQHWIFTVATGLFLYVALVDMLPAIMNVKDHKPWLIFILHNLGLLIGWTILLLLSIYEENITV
ncbi:zinc transporter ZIP4 isoform X2 [Dendrobates tinctorius]|uniref:zinc transporter ZIP4 isoform X2 n=1 Tax=Dendrobates tinctorius TaxID=92724 RepID=UPI003CC97D00